MSLYSETLNYITSLTCSQGDGAGQPMQVFPWQKTLLKEFLEPEVVTGALSVARGNGKTAFLAAVAAAALDGPLAKEGAEVTLVASSFDQAKFAFRHVEAFLREKCDLNRRDWRVVDNDQRAQITYRPLRTILKVRASDPRRAHGIAPSLVLADEPAQWPKNNAELMVSALRTSMGKIPEAKMMALGTRPADDEHWFARWLNEDADMRRSYSAEDGQGYGLLTVKAARLANPSWKYLPTLQRELKKEMQDAKKNTALLSSYKSLRLNMGLPDVDKSVLLDAELWKELETSGQPMREGVCIWGVDLGSSNAMSAISAYYPETGWLETLAAFPEHEGLAALGSRDNVGDLYTKMAEREELMTTAGRTVDITELVEAAADRFGTPDYVASDHWRATELLDALERINHHIIDFTTRRVGGWQDGGEDVRRFRKRAIERQIKAPRSLLMRSAIGGAMTVSDQAGNHRLAKHGDKQSDRRALHRDDAAAASILAVAEGDRLIADLAAHEAKTSRAFEAELL